MKVVHVLDHSLPLHSGYAFRTVAILREQRALGWETLHLTTPRQGPVSAEAETVDGWEFHRTALRNTPRRHLPAVGAYLDEMESTRERLRQMVRAHRPDIIHAHSPVLNALPALEVGQSEQVPVVYEMRALWEDAAVDHGTTREGSLRYRASRALETRALRRADGIAVICDGLRREVEARGVARGRITLIPNAVDADDFTFDPVPDPELRTRLGLDGKLVVGFLGSFYAYEGLDLLLEAVRRLQADHPTLRLLLAGGGPEEQRLQARVSELGLSAAVLFVGRVPHADVARYYSIVDLLVYPRRRMRLTDLVTPLKPLEAMAMGRIVVASDVGGHRELIEDSATGFLFPADDASALAARLSAVLAQRAGWEAMRLRARRFVEEQRSWKRSVAGYVELYQRLCGIRRPSAVAVACEKSIEPVSR